MDLLRTLQTPQHVVRLKFIWWLGNRTHCFKPHCLNYLDLNHSRSCTITINHLYFSSGCCVMLFPQCIEMWVTWWGEILQAKTRAQTRRHLQRQKGTACGFVAHKKKFEVSQLSSVISQAFPTLRRSEWATTKNVMIYGIEGNSREATVWHLQQISKASANLFSNGFHDSWPIHGSEREDDVTWAIYIVYIYIHFHLSL